MEFSSLWSEDGSNDLHNKSLTLSLLEICYSLSSLNVLQVLQRFFEFEGFLVEILRGF